MIEDTIISIMKQFHQLSKYHHQLVTLQEKITELNQIQIIGFEEEISLRNFLITTTSELLFHSSETLLDLYTSIDHIRNYHGEAHNFRKFKLEMNSALKRFKRWNQKSAFHHSLSAKALRKESNLNAYYQKENQTIDECYSTEPHIIFHLHELICTSLCENFPEEIHKLRQEKDITLPVEFDNKRKIISDYYLLLSKLQGTPSLGINHNVISNTINVS